MSEAGERLLSEARRLLHEHRAREDGGDGNVIQLPEALLPDLNRVIAQHCASTTHQLVPFRPGGWETESFEHLVWRQVAASREVERTYMAPHRGVASEKLEQQLALDQEAGIEARVAFVSALPEDMQGPGIGATWIVDGEVVVSGSTPGQLTVSRRQTDLNAAIDAWRTVGAVSESVEAASEGQFDLEEPLVLSADLISNVAEVLCAGDHVSPTGCGWYHAAWQYLRLMDMVSTPTWHSEFYLSSLERVFDGKPGARTLITGTADYSMFAYVDLAARKCCAAPQVTALDLCATPLFACRWYGKRVERHIATVSEDIMAFAGSPTARASWDLIVTDAFLTRFSLDEMSEIANAWRALLRPTGTLITTVRIHSETPQGREEEAAVRDFARRVRRRSERWQPFLVRSPEEIATLAETYAQRMASTHVDSESAIRQLLTDAGFELKHTALTDVPGELHPTTYLEVVCTSR